MSCKKMTPEECAALAARIADLTTSYEELLAGTKARVLVDQNGERIEYNGGNSRSLFTYIKGLEGQFSRECTTCRRAVSRPIRPFF